MTETRATLLARIRTFIDGNGYPPTYREMAHMMAWRSHKTAYYHVQRLEEGGYVTLDSRRKVRLAC